MGVLVMCGISLQDRLVVRVQSWLMSRGQGAAAAASIAELLGKDDPEHILALARKSCVCVTADKLTFKDLHENKPNPALALLTQRAHLGQIDAFVSHSWSDEPALKWAALQKWRCQFKDDNGGREPRLWIDKYCIDQTNIDESLQCLPVYLAGSNKLLVLCGKTYLQRLWCLIEIFVFIEMGGQLANLEVHLLSPEIRETVKDSPSRSSSSHRGTLVAGL